MGVDGPFHDTVLRCPVCGASFSRRGNSLVCTGPKSHCYDMARSGYVHFAQRRPGGDSPEAVRARTVFLEAGYYERAAEELVKIVSSFRPSGTLLDAGCGEGYYTNRFARTGRYRVFGTDLSKPAVDHAARAAKREENGAFYFVSSLFGMPVADRSCDVVTSVFAPCAEGEFCRVLKDDGILVVAGAGEDHLLGLRQALYDTVSKSGEREDRPRAMRCLADGKIRYEITVRQEHIPSLFHMTPYYWKTSLRDAEKLQGLKELKTAVEFDYAVYGKGSF